MTGPLATASIFATYLPDHSTLWRGFLDEVSGPVWVPFLQPSPPSRQPSQSKGQELWMGSVLGSWGWGHAEALWFG